MRSAIRVMQMGALASVAFAASAAFAAPVQLLLSENFQGVTGLGTAETIRTLADAASKISVSPAATFSNTGNASEASFNVRRDDNEIDAANTGKDPKASSATYLYNLGRSSRGCRLP